jgi:hypothetical protein
MGSNLKFNVAVFEIRFLPVLGSGLLSLRKAFLLFQFQLLNYVEAVTHEATFFPTLSHALPV